MMDIYFWIDLHIIIMTILIQNKTIKIILKTKKYINLDRMILVN